MQNLDPINQTKELFKTIKVEHSIFALPFVLLSAFIASDGWPSFNLILLIIAAVFFARTSGMAFNRFLDAEIDALNPRTSSRSIPAGRLSKSFTLVSAILSALLFLVVCTQINFLALTLSPIVLLVVFGYSFAKRFTSYCHFILGLALGISPIGAWVAIRGELAWLPVLLGLAVLLWTAGFDIIYSLQDVEVDRKLELNSIPSKIGQKAALNVSRILHVATLIIFFVVGSIFPFNNLYWIGYAIAVICLLVEHILIWNINLKYVNSAFFTVNGVMSVLFGLFAILSVLAN